MSAEPRLGLTRSDPKPAKRYRASPAEWKYMRSLLLVEPCAICGGRSESLHHIYKRGQGGGDLLVNLAPVCGSGTTGCHGKLEARDPEALATLGHWVGAAFITYLASVLGDTDRAWAWVERNLLLSERERAVREYPKASQHRGNWITDSDWPHRASSIMADPARSENSKSAASVYRPAEAAEDAGAAPRRPPSA